MLAFRLVTAFLACIALPAPALAQAPAAALTIDVANFSFTPNPIRLPAGKPVTLTFTNKSGSGHDFTAREFFAAATITAGAAPDGKIDLTGHETKIVTLIPRAGTYGAHCSHFLHASMGMTDTIMVQ